MICTHCDTPIPENSRFCLSCGADTSDPGTGPRHDFKAPSDRLFAQLRAAVVERYELEQLLGRGGMGAVFLATDRKLERPVAIKVLPPELSHDSNVVERFDREARTAARLDHPNIIPIYSVESHGEFHYFVMKYVAGKSLEDVLRAGIPPIDLTQRILWDAACALGHAHQRGIVHRDVKPANIMIDDTGRTILTDFGISKAVQSAANQLTATGQVVGTPHYMSPEQSKGGHIDGRSDQYSLAVVGFKMLTGTLPFKDDSIQAVLYKKLFEDPPWVKDFRDDIPDFVAEAIHTALAREPEHRFPSMEAFATALWPEHRVAEASVPRASMGRPSRASMDAATTQIDRKAAAPAKRRRWGAAVVVTATVVVGGSFGAWYAMNAGRDQTRSGVQPVASVPAVPPDTQAVLIQGDSGGADSTMTMAEAQVAQGAPESDQRTPARREGAAPSQTQPPTTEQRRTEPTVERSTAPAVGYVTLNAVPFATVWIDNVEVQDTPVHRHELVPGRHIIELRREGYRTMVDTVLVTAGNEMRKSYTMVPIP